MCLTDFMSFCKNVEVVVSRFKSQPNGTKGGSIKLKPTVLTNSTTQFCFKQLNPVSESFD